MPNRFYIAVAISDEPLPRILAQTRPLAERDQAENAARAYAAQHVGTLTTILSTYDTNRGLSPVFRGEVKVESDYLDHPIRAAGEEIQREPPVDAWIEPTVGVRPTRAEHAARHKVGDPVHTPHGIGVVREVSFVAPENERLGLFYEVELGGVRGRMGFLEANIRDIDDDPFPASSFGPRGHDASVAQAREVRIGDVLVKSATPDPDPHGTEHELDDRAADVAPMMSPAAVASESPDAVDRSGA